MAELLGQRKVRISGDLNVGSRPQNRAQADFLFLASIFAAMNAASSLTPKSRPDFALCIQAGAIDGA